MAVNTRTFTPKTVDGTITSYLPLTTEHPYLEGCSTAWWANCDIATGCGPVAFDPKYAFKVRATMKCFPDQAASWWSHEALSLVNQGVTTRYSVGPVVCPEAYTTANVNSRSGYDEVACCPRDYNFVSSVGPGRPAECTSALSSGQVLTYIRPRSNNDYEAVNGFLTTSITLTARNVAFAAHVNGINFPRDSSTTTSFETSSGTSATPSSTSSIATPTGSSALSSSSSQSITNNNASSNKLGTGAIAGIAVGAVLGVLLIALIAFVLFRRKRKTRAAETGYDPNVNMVHEESKWKNGQGMEYAPVEMGSGRETRPGVHELPSPGHDGR